MLNLYILLTCVCSMNTFYTSPRRTDRSTTVLQCSLKISTLTPKISSLRNIFPRGVALLRARVDHRGLEPKSRGDERGKKESNVRLRVSKETQGHGPYIEDATRHRDNETRIYVY